MESIDNMNKYDVWINNYIKENKILAGFCFSASKQMVETFPELKQIKGYVVTEFSGSSAHWWCEDANGKIYDPTALQFEDIISYEQYNEEKHGPLPTGKCYDCGDYIYDEKDFCDENCESSTREYLNNVICPL